MGLSIPTKLGLGFIVLKRDGALFSTLAFKIEDKREGPVTIIRLVTLPSHQRRGYATILLGVLKELICSKLAGLSEDRQLIACHALNETLPLYTKATGGFSSTKQPPKCYLDTSHVTCAVSRKLCGGYLKAAVRQPN